MVGRISLAIIGKSSCRHGRFSGYYHIGGSFYPQSQEWGRIGTIVGRLTAFFVGEQEDNEKQRNYNLQSNQARIAVAQGGLLGCGPGNSVQRNFLPHAYSDFIYAIIIEEYGLGGGCFIFLLYAANFVPGKG